MCEICFSRFYGYINSLITKIKESTVFNLLINLTPRYSTWCFNAWFQICVLVYSHYLLYFLPFFSVLPYGSTGTFKSYRTHSNFCLLFHLNQTLQILWTKCSIVSGSALAKSPQVIIMLFQFDTCIYALLMISRSQFMIENWEKKSMLLPMEIDRCINYQSDSHECFIINAYQ